MSVWDALVRSCTGGRLPMLSHAGIDDAEFIEDNLSGTLCLAVRSDTFTQPFMPSITTTATCKAIYMSFHFIFENVLCGSLELLDLSLNR